MEALYAIEKEHIINSNDVDIVFCQICHGIIRDAIDTNCGHLFCHDCLDKVSDKNVPVVDKG